MNAHLILEIIGAVLMAAYAWEALTFAHGNKSWPWIMQITYPVYCVAIYFVWKATR